MVGGGRTAMAWLLAASAAAHAAPGPAEQDVEKLPEVGQAAPGIAGYSTDGTLWTLKGVLKPATGKPARAVVVSFFATWCAPCEEGLPVIRRVVDERKTRGAIMVLVAKQEDAARVRKESGRLHLAGLTVVPDPYDHTCKAWGVTRRLPRTIVVDGDGKVRAVFTDESAGFGPALAAALDDVLGQ